MRTVDGYFDTQKFDLMLWSIQQDQPSKGEFNMLQQIQRSIKFTSIHRSLFLGLGSLEDCSHIFKICFLRGKGKQGKLLQALWQQPTRGRKSNTNATPNKGSHLTQPRKFPQPGSTTPQRPTNAIAELFRVNT